MGAEYLHHRARAGRARRGPGDYERRDTITSLTMGTASLADPAGRPQAPRALHPGQGSLRQGGGRRRARRGRRTSVADAVVRNADAAERVERAAGRPVGGRADRPRASTVRSVVDGPGWPARSHASAGSRSIATGGVAITTAWGRADRRPAMWSRRVVRDLGTGPARLAAAVLGWDFIYYWNHRFMHESRYMWAIHVVHHSSERYNLSTALRQPVADALGTFVPYGAAGAARRAPRADRAGPRHQPAVPVLDPHRRDPRLGPFEEVLNTPSHHRVHHGSNQQYIDRNHGSILIIWDRLFGTFEREDEPVVYGLTKNIDTFNPLRVAEPRARRDAAATSPARRTWRDRLSFVFRGPGWAYRPPPRRRRAPGSRDPDSRGPGRWPSRSRRFASAENPVRPIPGCVAGWLVPRMGHTLTSTNVGI